MKILYLSTPSFADCDIPLVRAMQAKGYDVTYLLMLAPHSLQYTIIDIKKEYPHTGVFASSVYPELKTFDGYIDMDKFFVANRTSNKSYSLSYWKKTLSIYRFIRRNKFDVIHTPCLFGLKHMLFYFAGCKVVTTIHDPFPHTGEKNRTSIQNRKIAVRYSNGITLLNNKQKDEFCSFYNISPNKLCINKLGVYENIALMASDVKTNKKNNVLFFGRISPYKGIEYLCKAMEIVRKEVPDATLTIAGSGRIYFDISPYVNKGYIDLHNRFIQTEEIATMLKQCSICVCPYTDATQSGVIMTSFALSKPVIASNVGGLGEMIDEGKSGLLVEPKNPVALANAILKLLKNPIELARMESYIHESYYKGKDSWLNIAETYIDFYKKIL
mgnify:FL=1